MIVGHQYVAMLITGLVHLVLGFCSAVTAISGMVHKDFSGQVIRTYTGVAFSVSLWISLVGVLGILAGIKSFPDDRTRKLKTAYMVLAILSAVIFSLAGLAMFILTFTTATVLGREWTRFITLGHVGSVLMALEFVMAIVSSSICCCCSDTSSSTTVIIQAPAGQAQPAVQYQSQSPPIYQPGAPINQ